MNENKLSVYLYGKLIGTLERSKNSKMTFMYKSDVTTPISLSMPLKENTFDAFLCNVFFSGLLPESSHARRNLSRIFNLEQKDTFGFLKEMGHDCAGAVTFYPFSYMRDLQESYPLKGRILSKLELEDCLQMIPERQYLVGIDGLRASLAGIQDKALVCLIDGKIAIPHDGCPTTHIIKPAGSSKSHILNEYICLKLAHQLGVEVPNVEVRHVGKIVFLVITRYDRIISNDNYVKRLHQEDFCQALGILPFRKYQYDGGPSLKDCFDLLKKTVVPVIERNRLMQMVIFNYLIANFFAHGKNFSLLYLPHNKFRLAPFYDLHCCYNEFASGRFAMGISCQYDATLISSSQWEHFCHKVGYAYPAFKKLFFESIDLILNAAEIERTELKAKWKGVKEAEKIDVFLQMRCEEALKKIQE